MSFPSASKDSRYRLVVDLSEIYEDERILSYILVDSKWERVSYLEEHVQNLFDVPDVYFMTEDGFYVPSQESIDVIKRTDVLRAVVPLVFRKKKQKIGVAESHGDGLTAREDRTQGQSNALAQSLPMKRRQSGSRSRSNVDRNKRLKSVETEKLPVESGSRRRSRRKKHEELSKNEGNSQTIRAEPEDATTDNESSETILKKPFPQPSMPVDKVLIPNSYPLHGLPAISDVIIFKMAQGEDKKPSEYMCGYCEEVDPAQNTIRCLLLDDFQGLGEDGAPMNRSGTAVRLKLDDLLDKRVLCK